MRRVAFLDRDGVLIENRSDYVKSEDEVAFLPGVFQALCRLAEAHIPAVIVTNQAVIGRGIITLDQAQQIQRSVVEVLTKQGAKVLATYMCPHHPEAGCACRKPAPGMLLQAAEELDIDLSASWFIGDALTDMEAARATGVRGILVCTGRGAAQLQGQMAEEPLTFSIVANILEATTLICTCTENASSTSP